jgi:hypothetical protein
MPVYEYDTFRDLKVYNVNVKQNKHVMIMFSGSWYPILEEPIRNLCHYMTLRYSNIFDIYTISSEKDYLTLYQNDCIYDLLRKCCINDKIKYNTVTCFCMCISAPFITNIIYKLNKTCVIDRVNVVCYESPFELFQQSLRHPYKSLGVNYARLKNNKRAMYNIYEFLYAPEYTRQLIDNLTKKISLRMLVKICSINMKTPYTLHCIYSKNDIMVDKDMNETYKMKPKRNGFKLYNYELESYSHIQLLNDYRQIIESSQYNLFLRHLDDIISRIIQ